MIKRHPILKKAQEDDWTEDQCHDAAGKKNKRVSWNSGGALC